MPIPLVTQHYPDEFATATFTITDGTLNGTALLYADRNLVVDSIVVNVILPTNNTPTTTDTIQLVRTTTGTATTPNAGSPAAITAGTSQALHTAASVTAIGTSTLTLTNTGTDNNLIRVGNWLGVVKVNPGANAFSAVVQIRYRSRIA